MTLSGPAVMPLMASYRVPDGVPAASGATLLSALSDLPHVGWSTDAATFQSSAPSCPTRRTLRSRRFEARPEEIVELLAVQDEFSGYDAEPERAC